MAEYQPYQDHWRRYEIPVRPGDHDSRAEGMLTCLVRADELTAAEYAALPAHVRAEVDADLAAMDAEAADAAVRTTYTPDEEDAAVAAE